MPNAATLAESHVYKATHRFAKVAQKKMLPLAKLIRGKWASKALEELRFRPNRGARLIEQVLRDALSNAADRGEYDIDGLRVVESRIDGGPITKRTQPRARGTADPIKVRCSHIVIGVSPMKNGIDKMAASVVKGNFKSLRSSARKNHPVRANQPLSTNEKVVMGETGRVVPPINGGSQEPIKTKMDALRDCIEAGDAARLSSFLTTELAATQVDSEWLAQLLASADEIDVPKEADRRQVSVALFELASAAISRDGEKVNHNALAATLRWIGESAPVDMAGQLLPFVESKDRDISQIAMNSIRTLFSAEFPPQSSDVEVLRDAVGKRIAAAIAEHPLTPALAGYLGCAFEAASSLADPILPTRVGALATGSGERAGRFVLRRLEQVRSEFADIQKTIGGNPDLRVELIDRALDALKSSARESPTR